jgi:diguanylate cyclase (GGDEF)-like protein/PAS domain S-box-containing protein
MPVVSIVPAAEVPPENRRTAPPVHAVQTRRRNQTVEADVSQIDPSWVLIAPIMAAGLLLTGIASLSLPSLLSASIATLAITIIAVTKVLLGWEVKHLHSTWQRFLLMLGSVGIPTFLYGMSLAEWTSSMPSAAWGQSLGVLVIIGTISAVILKGRLPSVMSAQVGLWAGVAAVAGSAGTWVVVAAGAAIASFTALRQADLENAATERRAELERNQLRAEELLNDFEQTGQGWFWETDRRGLISYVSPTVGEALQVSSDSLIGQPFTDLFILDGLGQKGERTLVFHLSARSPFHEIGVRAAAHDEERWWAVTGRPLFDGFNNFVGFRGSGHDLTEQRRSEENATRLAHYDSLTGLANRFQMSQTLERILAAQRIDHRACSVFLLDLDRFKQVNDTLGHPAGDALLKQVATRLEATVGKYGRVGRLGGDEFQVVIPGKHPLEDLAALAKRIIRNLSEAYAIDGHRVVIGASIGVALAPDDGVTSEAIIRNADLALYAAKDGGRGRHHFYAADLHTDAEERRQLEADLREALSIGGLELYYQPVVHTATERITGFEALLRWNHPTRGWLSPAKFIPVAEDTGLIAAIGEWALRTACNDLARWPESVRVAVNVSPLQFSNPALPAIVTNALASAQIAPERLELEITESVFLNDDPETDAMFTALKRVGIRLALDDFGTGYSSLGYLKKAPFDKIKIDQSFVRGATMAGSRNGAIIASIVSLAESLGMETTAEGVETLDELDLVRMLGCSHVQGYIYEKAISFEAASLKLQAGLTAIARGPRSARASRQTMLRKVVLDHGGQQYHGTIRNISATGAMVEGLWNVPPGTIFRINIADGQIVTATARWCQQDRMGIEFSSPLTLDDSGRIAAISTSGSERVRGLFRSE